MSNQDFLGIVLDYDEKTKTAIIEQRNYFKPGDIVEFFGPKHNIISYVVSDIFDLENNALDVVNHPRQIVKITVEDRLEKYDLTRIKDIDKIENI